MNPSSLKKLAESIKSEIALASQNKSSSFPYIRHPLPTRSTNPKDKIQVIVIGGSVFKKGVFMRRDGRLKLLFSEERLQPAFHTKNDFLDFCLSEIDTDIVDIGINFAYPLTPLLRHGRLDGVFTQSMKENRFEGMVGKKIGEELEKHVLSTTGKRISITIANDTICLLLSGLESTSPLSLMAGVIGTGINLAIFENEHSAVNLEAANFDKFDLSPAAQDLDKRSAAPKKALFEKEIAGGYLFEHYNYQLKRLGLRSRLLYSTRELDIIAASSGKEGEVAQEILTRSAQLTAALFAGASLFLKRDLSCVVEGSLFWKGYHYRETVEKTLSLLLPKHSVRLLRIKNSPLVGAAHLVS